MRQQNLQCVESVPRLVWWTMSYEIARIDIDDMKSTMLIEAVLGGRIL